MQHFRLLEKLDDIIFLSKNNGDFKAATLMFSDFEIMLAEHIKYENDIMSEAKYFARTSHEVTHQKYTKLVSKCIIKDPTSFYQNVKIIRISLAAHINLEADFFKKFLQPKN